ncbi:MAG: NAD(P)H-hydrate dehydratase [candidate division Zixibacteria bacterium]|nr:NAD(P)H-hydrate dehydratase [candidate division Zixibacteria bacterium]
METVLPMVLEAAAARTVVVLGCGLGRREGSGHFVREIVAKVEKPLLIDADGLFPLTGDALAARSHPTVITPHPGELARLAGISVTELSADRIGQARRLAESWGVVLVLKGAGTVVAEPSGIVVLQPFADDGLASGGTGDVLSGMIGGLLAQGVAPFAAALLGTYLHGRAREERRDLTGAYFSAADLITGIDPALRALGAG